MKLSEIKSGPVIVLPKFNHVLVEPVGDPDVIKIGDFDFGIDTSYQESKHQVTRGIVRAVPDSLYFTKKPGSHATMPWLTDMELQVGDMVYYDYLTAMNAKNPTSSTQFRVNGFDCIWMKYNQIYCAVREEEIVPVNGYCLVEPLKTMRSDMFDFSIMDNDHDQSVGVLRHVGSLIRWYRYHKHADSAEYKPGQIVLMKKVNDIPLESKYHESIDRFWRVQRRNILGVVDASLVDYEKVKYEAGE